MRRPPEPTDQKLPMNNDNPKNPAHMIRNVVLITLLLAALGYAYWLWQEKLANDEIVSGGLTVINYMDQDVYASVRNSLFPNPGEGASDGTGPHSGGGKTSCCIPIPARWRPGIKMNVWFSHKDWQEENGVTKVIELPPYPDGEPGSVYLVFHSDTEIELMSTIFAPRHPRWPGRHVEPVIEGLK